MGAGVRFDAYLELIAAGDTGRRMQHDGVAHAGAFGIERLLHAQGAAMLAPGEDGRVVTAREAERE